MMTTLDAAAIELANSLQIEAVPAKLRCGSCNKLAVNAVKLPCCDQSICEPCSQELPETCPICGHSPLSADDCKPNKSLRMTVKAFIKSEERKRSKESEALVQKTAAADIPLKPEERSMQDGGNESVLPSVEDPALGRDAGVAVASHDEDNSLEKSDNQSGLTVAQASNEALDDGQDEDEIDEDDVIITTERPEDDAQLEPQENSNVTKQSGDNQSNIQFQMNSEQAFGFGQDQQGFSNMDFNQMNFNPMAMPPGMGMGNFPMGMPNMLGMPGMNMNMDPSMMFGGGGGNGFGGMSMADMNMMSMAMGMGGMGGFDGGMGSMNGPQAGFFPGQGGYNHQNFGNQMNHSFPNHSYGRPYGRGGYGRGRGGYGYNRGGRGGWQNYPNQQYGQNQYMNHQQQQGYAGRADIAGDVSQPSDRRGSSAQGSTNPANGITNASNDDRNNVSAEKHSRAGSTSADQTDINREQSAVRASSSAGLVQDEIQSNGPNPHHEPANGDASGAENLPTKDSTMGSSVATEVAASTDSQVHQAGVHRYEHQSAAQDGYMNGHASFRGGRSSSAYGQYSAVGGAEPVQPAPPINAPTGPKAMRAGLPNSGFYSRPQFQQQAPAPARAQQSQQVQQEQDQERIIAQDPKKNSEQDSQHRSRSKSTSKSPRRYRDNTPLEKDDSDEHGRRSREKRRKREKGRRHRDEDSINGDRSDSRVRSRSASPDDRHFGRQGRNRDEERHGSRSRHDRSRDRRKRRERERSGSGERERNTHSHNGSRHRPKSDRRRDDRYEERNRSRDKDRQKSRRESSRDDQSRRSDRARNHESRRRSRTSPSRDDGKGRDRDSDSRRKAVLEQPADDIGFKIKGGSKRHNNEEASLPPPTGPRNHDRKDRRSSKTEAPPASSNNETSDSYAAERQAREQARLERHRSQLAQTSRSGSLGKRVSRDEDDVDVPTGPKAGSGHDSRRGKKARPMSYKYEDEIRDTHDDRDSRRWR